MRDLVGRKPAPGKLRDVQEFLNTANVKTGRENLPTPGDLRDFLVGRGLLDAAAPVSDADLKQALAVRSALYRVVDARLSGRSDPESVETLNRAIRTAHLCVSIDDTCTAGIEPLAPAVDGALGKLLAIVVEAMGDNTWERLKVCRSDTCSWAFYDRSKNRSGAWCDITDCGNVAKARAYRARHAQS